MCFFLVNSLIMCVLLSWLIAALGFVQLISSLDSSLSLMFTYLFLGGMMCVLGFFISYSFFTSFFVPFVLWLVVILGWSYEKVNRFSSSGEIDSGWNVFEYKTLVVITFFCLLVLLVVLRIVNKDVIGASHPFLL